MFIVSMRRLKLFTEQLISSDEELQKLMLEAKLKKNHRSDKLRISPEVQEHLDLIIKAELEKGLRKMKERRQMTLTKSCFT